MIILLYQPPCGTWYVHSHRIYGSRDEAREAARKFLAPGTTIALLPLAASILDREIV